MEITNASLGYKQASYNKGLYDDGWYRTFKGIPDFSSAVKRMLKRYVEKEQHSRVMIFFVGKCGYDNGYSEFLLRELINDNI